MPTSPNLNYSAPKQKNSLKKFEISTFLYVFWRADRTRQGLGWLRQRKSGEIATFPKRVPCGPLFDLRFKGRRGTHRPRSPSMPFSGMLNPPLAAAAPWEQPFWYLFRPTAHFQASENTRTGPFFLLPEQTFRNFNRFQVSLFPVEKWCGRRRRPSGCPRGALLWVRASALCSARTADRTRPSLAP